MGIGIGIGIDDMDSIRLFQILSIVILVGSFFWGWFETHLSIRLAHRLGLLAPVTHRSAHREPTPTIGGLGIVDTVLIVAIVLNLFRGPDDSLLYGHGIDARAANWVLIVCGIAMALMGLVDDWRGVPPWPKFALQVACALPPAWFFRHGAWIGEDTWVWLWGGQVFNPRVVVVHDTWMWLTFAFNLMWMLLVINIFNFMDGMDGLAGLFTAVVAIVIAALALQIHSISAFAGVGEIFFITLALIGSTLGFLRLNLPPAQTFMGDVGSQFLGWLLATLALMAHVPLEDTAEAPRLWAASWAPLLLFLPFLGDGLFTMARRLWHGENIFTPHFSHLYQRLLSRGRTHAQVLLVESAVIFSCAALTLALLFVRPALQPLLGVAGLGVMVSLWLHVRVVETEGG
jgi:UDP-N-acetylmuramyl pentapeptide phosphotransferase/UDP-N-acetylglucosamine-1-phosphate transferase